MKEIREEGREKGRHINSLPPVFVYDPQTKNVIFVL